MATLFFLTLSGIGGIMEQINLNRILKMFDLFKKELEGKKFSSEEEYNAEILRVSHGLEEELGRVERFLLTDKSEEVLEEYGVEINEK